MPPNPLINFEIQKYYENEPRFNGLCCRDKLPKIKDRVYVINLDECSDFGTYWLALWVNNNNNDTCLNSFGVEHIPKEFKTIIGHKNIKTNIFSIQEYD